MAYSKCRNVNNLDSLLADIYDKYVKIREDDFKLHYKVFDSIWNCLHLKMKEVDEYYGLYSSKVQTMGSHYDRLRIKKPDEFDIFNVILLPSKAEKNVVIEPEQASFVFLETDKNCRRVLKHRRKNWEANKQFLEWVDDNGRIQRSKFFDWFKGVVDKALNDLEPTFIVDGEEYIVKRSETGPAVTLIITSRTSLFQMDVDFVPALKFPSLRWPPGPNYRAIPDDGQNYDWMVVAKPDKDREENIRHLQWRIALPEQERNLIGDSYNLRQAMRLLKKLRDTQGMTKLVSYFLKQLVYMKVDQGYDHSFWRQSPAVLFKVMVEWLYDAMKIRRIPYFWNTKNNLLQRVDQRTLEVYEKTLFNLIKVLNDPNNYMKVANYLLTPEELRNYN